MRRSYDQGLTLVEVMIASAIILSAVMAMLGVYTLYLRVALSNGNAVKAAYLAEEGLEAVRFLRDDSWSARIVPLSNGTAYGIALSGGLWQATTTSWVGNFERTFTLSAVSRDTNSDIVSSGGTLDPNIRLVTASVSWTQAGATTTKSISTYLTNLHGN